MATTDSFRRADNRAGRGRLTEWAVSARGFIFLMLLPAMALLVAFTIVPFAVSLWLSLTDYILSNPPARFIGIGNYVELMGSGEFWRALWRSAVFTVLSVAVELALGLTIAVFLHGTLQKWAGPLRTVYLLPLAVTPVAAIFTFRMMLNPSLGVANHFMQQLGLPPQDWLGNPSLAMFSLVLFDAWHWTPFIVLILAGGLASLPSEPHEAAQIDGATDMQVLRYITLPMLTPFIVVAVLLRSIDALKAFDPFYILTGGGPGQSTTTLNVFAFKEALEFTALGRGSAIAIIMMIIIVILSQVALRRTRLLKVAEDQS